MKRTPFLMIAVLLISLALASVASADLPFGPLKWSQPIDRIAGETYNGKPVYNGWDEPSSTIIGWTPDSGVADDWKCRDNRPVTDIHWWGSYVNWIQPTQPAQKPTSFWFGMYKDIPAPADGKGYSQPGALIWGYEAAAGGYEEVFVGYDKDPRTGNITDSTFQYNVTLPAANWFIQDPSQNSIYWLSIVAMYRAEEPQLLWGWKTRPHFYQDDAVKRYELGGWERVGILNSANDFESWDMAFELSTVPEPSSLLALGMGVAGLAGFIRRRM